MSFLSQVAELWRESKGTTHSKDNYKYVIRKRDGTFWTNEKGGRWLPEKKKNQALVIRGANKAFDYVEQHLWEYADDVDVVIP